MPSIPQIKKKISSFLTKEDGKISKEKILKAGMILGVAGLAMAKNASAGCPPSTADMHQDHCNGVDLTEGDVAFTGTHSHSHGSHASHSSHSSHSSHGSHSSWGGW